MPDDGSYILTNVGFSKTEEPILLLQHSDTFTTMLPIGQAFTLIFDMTTRYCIGWRDITNAERFTCPDKNIVDIKYEQCAACQKRTGFNPAFYHAVSVSAQQEARNQEPHILYLAHFGAGVIKVGISLAARGNSRLLEQGARSAVILGTFPSANIARQYEAQIAQIPGIVETLQQRKKSALLTRAYDAQVGAKELIQARDLVEKATGTTFERTSSVSFNHLYFPHTAPSLSQSHDITDKHLLSGTGVGMVGSVLFTQLDDSLLHLQLKKHVGYTVTLTTAVTPIETPVQQTSLF